MDCRKASELIPEYVVNALSDDEQSALQVHLDSGCLRCNRELDELKAAASLFGEALDPVSPSAELKSVLLDRIANEPQEIADQVTLASVDTTHSTHTPARWKSYVPLAAATLIAVAAGSLVANFTAQRGSEQGVAQVDPSVMQQWQRSIDAAEQAFGPPRAQLIGFDASLREQQFQAAVFYDGIAQQLHILASKVSQPPPGQQPYLWLLDADGKVLSGSALRHVDRQRAAAIVDLPTLPKNIAGAVITHEPIGNPSEPKGPELGRATLKQTT